MARHFKCTVGAREHRSVIRLLEGVTSDPLGEGSPVVVTRKAMLSIRSAKIGHLSRDHHVRPSGPKATSARTHSRSCDSVVSGDATGSRGGAAAGNRNDTNAVEHWHDRYGVGETAPPPQEGEGSAGRRAVQGLTARVGRTSHSTLAAITVGPRRRHQTPPASCATRSSAPCPWPTIPRDRDAHRHRSHPSDRGDPRTESMKK